MKTNEKRPLVYIDFESFLFAPGNMAPKPVCMSYKRDNGGGILVTWEEARQKLLPQMLEDAKNGKIILAAHYAAYDFNLIYQHAPELRHAIFDAFDADAISCTRLREKLLDIAEGQSKGIFDTNGVWVEVNYHLDGLAKKYFNRDLDKDPEGWRMRYGELDGLPISEYPPRARNYAIEDSVTGHQMFHHQKARALRIGYLMPTEYYEARADFALRMASNWGVHTDEARVQALWDSIHPRMLEIQKTLVENGLMRPKRKKDLVALQQLDLGIAAEEEIIFAKNMKAIRDLVEFSWPKALGAVPRTKTKAVKTDKETILSCDSEILQMITEYNSLQKTGSTYVKKMFEGIEVPLHSRFDAIGAETDRTASEKPNLQNQPRMPGLRECFKAREGHYFLACDYSSQEMRTFAQTLLDVVGESKLAGMYQSDPNYDPHQEFADHSGSTRKNAKVVNFGIPGGLGVKGLVGYAKSMFGLVWTEQFAQKMKNDWMAHYPEAKKYFAHIRTLVGNANYGYQVIPRSGFKRGAVTFTEGSNGYFQTLGAHITKDALWEVTKRCHDARLKSPLLGSRVWNFVHDELILEVPIEAGHEAAIEIESVMNATMNKWTPDVPAASEAAIMRYWTKGAEPVYNAEGRLIPWEDRAA